jgi:hypothetical protein
MGVKVRAIARGVYGRLYEPGQVFEILDDRHLGSWMEPVEEKDRDRLADRLAAFAVDRRPPPPAGVPLTTGPGVPGALAKPPGPTVPKPIAGPATVNAPAKTAEKPKEPPKA